MTSFIEHQFPISRLSRESYKERKANASQTLTGLGKWWGRKPLILIRATLLGLLLPATDNPRRDREVFLQLLTMDAEGLRRRKDKTFSGAERLERLTDEERRERDDLAARAAAESDPARRRALRAELRRLDEELEGRVFDRLPYDGKLALCCRPEHLDGPSPAAWADINAHLGTTAASLPELVAELGRRRFGHVPRVGDAFCGGGSVPFEAARIGCEAHGSDLNPVAALLTWAALNIVGGGPETAEAVRQAQRRVYEAVDRQVTEWGIEHNAAGERADAYLYCVETRCPECGWSIPLAPSWLIGEKTRCIARLRPDPDGRRFDLVIESDVPPADLAAAKAAGTVRESALVCPHCGQSTPLKVVRGDRDDGYGLRPWTNDDLVPRPDDVFQERLYAIRWVRTWTGSDGRERSERRYAAPDADDLRREDKVLRLLRERFADWQAQGFLPSRRIEPGYNTEQPIRERGWTHWHHLFNPRQLLVGGLLNVASADLPHRIGRVAGLLGLQRAMDHNARLSGWSATVGKELVDHVFANQALNTLNNFGTRAVSAVETAFLLNLKSARIHGAGQVSPADARSVQWVCDLWVTDPPYADAVNYHELAAFFLCWTGERLARESADWYSDTRRALAVTGADETFRRSMVDCYANLARHMPEDGMQVVMFTHQDAAVWADLALILWASGLRVTAAWCVATETDSALKEGNYVQGTVLLVLRRQTAEATAFLDELYPQVEAEVRRQMDAMLELDAPAAAGVEEPNFGDTDYQLAAYAAALRVLTQYRRVEDFDIVHELTKPRDRSRKSPVEAIIADAVRTACDHLVPRGLESPVWRTLTPPERFYLKGLEIEGHGEHRAGVYQELARGFGLAEYTALLASAKANAVRLRTATEFAARELGDSGFGATLVRHALFAVREAVRTGEAGDGRNWLRNEVPDYWDRRRTLIEVLRYLSRVTAPLPHWREDAAAATLVAGALENDHV